MDACVWGGAAGEVRAAGHDVLCVADWDRDPGDAEILRLALGEERVVVTADKDFGELAVVRGMKHSGILRLVGISARRQGSMCNRVIGLYEDELRRGALLTVEPGRVRIRPSDGPA